MLIDFDFDFYSDARDGHPDSTSITLRKYHQFLWSRTLPNGKKFTLKMVNNKYLYHHSELGEFFLGSDAITHSYRNHKKKQWLIKQISKEANELFTVGKTIASYIIYPNNRINNKHTINQARGCKAMIDDRFDLTLECIKLFYSGKHNPLYDVLNRYKNFFDLFENFNGYIDYFFLNDLIDENGNIKFYLPFDNFKTKPGFNCIEDYMVYKKNVTKFILARKQRIKIYLNQ